MTSEIDIDADVTLQPGGLPEADVFDFPLGEVDASGRRVTPTAGQDADDYVMGLGGLSGFLERNDSGRGGIHVGEDWSKAGRPKADVGDAVHAASAGVVRDIDHGGGKGKDALAAVLVEHALLGGGSVFILYGNLDDDSLGTLRVGDAVERGEALGELGRTKGEDPHLHLEVRTADNPRNDAGGAEAREHVRDEAAALDGWYDPSTFLLSYAFADQPDPPTFRCSVNPQGCGLQNLILFEDAYFAV